ncbi:MAG TPA: ABC transporter ATP-binding protein [Pyrinomonadaceae bacterium]|jgi:ABC-2 type transport system ATP-binding protein|nr:ABC transporter ATP-binding protein [Pyrinomonadaceae bacterium]
MEQVESAVSVKNLTKKYGRLVALDELSLEVNHGEIMGLLGRNGAGKTTLIEILEGLREADQGEVSVLGFDPGKNLDAIKQRIGIQLQSSSFFRKLRVIEVLRQFRSYYQKKADIDELLDMVALNEKRNSFINDLSGGQKQRLALALALVNEPEIVFLDEPTAGLDAQVRRQLWHTIKQMKASGKTILLTTHYIEEAEHLCDRVCIIDGGRKLALDTPANLIKQASNHSNRVSFSTSQPFSLSALKFLTPLEVMENGTNSYVAEALDTGPSIVELVSAIEQQHNELLELQISRTTLEDVFIDMTGKEIKA